jgi:hypothetical protein
MAAERIPVIHLLNVKGLCERYGLPWDPRPLPAPGEGPVYGRVPAGSSRNLALTVLYLAAMVLTLALFRRRFLI